MSRLEPSNNTNDVKDRLRKHQLHSSCEAEKASHQKYMSQWSTRADIRISIRNEKKKTVKSTKKLINLILICLKILFIIQLNLL